MSIFDDGSLAIRKYLGGNRTIQLLLLPYSGLNEVFTNLLLVLMIQVGERRMIDCQILALSFE